MSWLFASGGQRTGVSASAQGLLNSTEDSTQYIITNGNREESEKRYGIAMLHAEKQTQPCESTLLQQRKSSVRV